MKQRFTVFIAMSCLLVFSSSGRSATIDVPGEFLTIQAAIEAAVDGDLILVGPGEYVEDLDFLGKDITVLSTSGPGATTIRGTGAGSVVTFSNGESEGAILDGFTITGGSSDFGAGIYCSFSSPFIRNNIIYNNHANLAGGAIYGFASSPRVKGNRISGNSAGQGSTGWGGAIYLASDSSANIRYNIIRNNTASTDGGGIYCYYLASPAIRDNNIFGNSASQGGGGIHCYFNAHPVITNNKIFENHSSFKGGAIHLVDNCYPTLTNNTIWHNSAGIAGGGIHSQGFSLPTVTNCILWNNTSNSNPQINGNADVTFSNVQGGFAGAGNMNADPQFVDPSTGDFHLMGGSPCVDRGNNAAPALPNMDFEGDNRVSEGDMSGGINVDIGADELLPHVAARFGTVNDANHEIKNVVLVNGSAGDHHRVATVPVGASVTVSVVSPSAGPTNATFVMYAWEGEGTVDSISPQPFGLGVMSFSTPLVGGGDPPLVIWNNLGHTDRLGEPTEESSAAPTTLMTLPNGIDVPSVLTFQGIIRDYGTSANKQGSVTNAVVLRVE